MAALTVGPRTLPGVDANAVVASNLRAIRERTGWTYRRVADELTGWRVHPRGRRLFAANPDASLFLAKASGKVPHGGGKRLNAESADYQVLRRWIAAG